jgi:hypothetical protein
MPARARRRARQADMRRQADGRTREQGWRACGSAAALACTSGCPQLERSWTAARVLFPATRVAAGNHAYLPRTNRQPPTARPVRDGAGPGQAAPRRDPRRGGGGSPRQVRAAVTRGARLLHQTRTKPTAYHLRSWPPVLGRRQKGEHRPRSPSWATLTMLSLTYCHPSLHARSMFLGLTLLFLEMQPLPRPPRPPTAEQVRPRPKRVAVVSSMAGTKRSCARSWCLELCVDCDRSCVCRRPWAPACCCRAWRRRSRRPTSGQRPTTGTGSSRSRRLWHGTEERWWRLGEWGPPATAPLPCAACTPRSACLHAVYVLGRPGRASGLAKAANRFVVQERARDSPGAVRCLRRAGPSRG